MCGSAMGESETASCATGVLRCTRCQAYAHALAQCRAVVQHRQDPNPPLHIYFDAGKLPPSYHYVDYSYVLTSTALDSLTTQQWVTDRRKRQRQ